MWIEKLEIKDYRAFQKSTKLNLSKNLTAISGMNGVGKSTILAILTNVGEISPKYKTISGTQFRGEFSNVIMYDEDFDKPGDKVSITFSDLPENSEKYNVVKDLEFRATRQKSIKRHYKYHKILGTENYKRIEDKEFVTRYRLIPKKVEGHNNEKKIEWPSLYLGLSRLVPLGEYDIAVPKKISPKIIPEIIQAHSEILGENLDENTKFANLDIGVSHLKSEVNTNYYGFKSNSSGQDNTGQIIEAVLSFKILKNELKEKYIGGILAIDEIDATLHPAAQNRLIDWLLKKSEELNIQIVFTTHSLTLLEHLSRLQADINSKKILINYLSMSKQEPGNVRVMENPPVNYYRNNLQDTYVKMPTEDIPVKIMSEDETARWFFNKLITISGRKYELPKFDELDVKMSWTTLVNLLNADANNYKKYVFLLDPDMSITNEKSALKEYMENNIVNFKVNSTSSNLLILPGNNSVEKGLWQYVNNLSDNDPMFSDPLLEEKGVINTDYIKQMNNFDQKEVYPGSSSAQIKVDENLDSKTYKLWFKYIADYKNIFIKYWIKDHANEVNEFLGILSKICKKIKKDEG